MTVRKMFQQKYYYLAERRFAATHNALRSLIAYPTETKSARFIRVRIHHCDPARVDAAILHTAPASAAGRVVSVCFLGFAFWTLSLSARAEDASPPVFNWAGMYLGASLGGGFPLHSGERLQATSGFGSPVFDLLPQRRHAAWRHRRAGRL